MSMEATPRAQSHDALAGRRDLDAADDVRVDVVRLDRAVREVAQRVEALRHLVRHVRRVRVRPLVAPGRGALAASQEGDVVRHARVHAELVGLRAAGAPARRADEHLVATVVVHERAARVALAPAARCELIISWSAGWARGIRRLRVRLSLVVRVLAAGRETGAEHPRRDVAVVGLPRVAVAVAHVWDVHLLRARRVRAARRGRVAPAHHREHAAGEVEGAVVERDARGGRGRGGRERQVADVAVERARVVAVVHHDARHVDARALAVVVEVVPANEHLNARGGEALAAVGRGRDLGVADETPAAELTLVRGEALAVEGDEEGVPATAFHA